MSAIIQNQSVISINNYLKESIGKNIGKEYLQAILDFFLKHLKLDAAILRTQSQCIKESIKIGSYKTLSQSHKYEHIVKDIKEESLNDYKGKIVDTVINGNKLIFIVLPKIREGVKGQLFLFYSPLSENISQSNNSELLEFYLERITVEIERYFHEKEIFELTTKDPLTKLYNNYGFNEYCLPSYLNSKLPTKMSILYFSINNLKNIIELYGREFSNKLLVAFSKKIKLLPGFESNTAHIAESEFAALIPTEFSEDTVFVEKLHTLTNDPILIGNISIDINISVGVSQYPVHSKKPKILNHFARLAMYSAVNNQKKNVYFDYYLKEQLERRKVIEARLNKAVNNGSLYIVYQPIHCAKTLAINGLECLVRWDDPALGNVIPDEFIPVAEANGLIDELTKFIINTVILDTRHLVNIKKYINISGALFNEKSSIKLLKQLSSIDRSDRNICLEVTETSLITNTVQACEFLNQCSGLGYHIALDDFGVGYSSLNYLRLFPVDILKIDKSFISEIDTLNSSHKFINSIIQLSKNLDLIVIAEGIETQFQLEFLKATQCDLYQGNFFSKPKIIEAYGTELNNNIA